MQKGFAPILIVLLIAVLGIGGYFIYRDSSNNQAKPAIQPTTTDETASWKTYTNTKYGYSIKYPKSFELVKGPGVNLSEGEFQKLDHISFSGMQKGNDSNSGVVLSINVNPQDASGKVIQCTSNDECLNKWIVVLNKSADEVKSVTHTIMGKSIKGFEYESKNNLYSQTYQYFVYPEKGNVWNINITINNYSLEKVIPTLAQILSTFKFTQ